MNYCFCRKSEAAMASLAVLTDTYNEGDVLQMKQETTGTPGAWKVMKSTHSLGYPSINRDMFTYEKKLDPDGFEPTILSALGLQLSYWSPDGRYM